MTISTDENFKKILAKTGKLAGDIREAAKRALVRSVTHVNSQVLGSGRVPYKRGDLRRSIKPFYENIHSPSGDMSGGTGTDKIYAPIHELGLAVHRTSAWGRPTRPYVAQYKERAFLRIPFQESQPTIEAIFAQEMESAVKFE